MFSLFGAIVGAKVHAFLAEFGMLAGAAACVVGALALIAYPIPILSRFQRVLAYVLFGVAVGLVCWFGGFREGRSLSAEADLRRQNEAQAAIIAEKDRQAKATADEMLARAMRQQEADSRVADMQSVIDDLEHQEPRVETKVVTVRGKTRVIDRCSGDDPAFARSLQRLDAAARSGSHTPKHPAAR